MDVTPPMQSAGWDEDCMRFYGKILDGEKAHYCHDWDGLPIDETCKELRCCHCVFASTVIP